MPALTLLAALHCATSAAATPLIPAAVTVVRTDTPPNIDGKLDDDAWQTAAPITDFTQVLPKEGAKPTRDTEVRLLHDADNLYIGVRCLDPDPDSIVAKTMQRDASLFADDSIFIVVDTFNTRRNGYAFQVGAAGGKRDGLVEAGVRTNYDWDTIWTAIVSRDNTGWSAEIAIPFKSIAFDPAGDRWAFNIEREIQSGNERVRWASPLINTRITTLSSLGEIQGLRDLNQGMGLTVKPFTTLDLNLQNGADLDVTPGVDVFYNFTPSVTGAITLNTDFAEAEVDEVVVNLSRFPTFFPEKRDFFLQDANVFEFGAIRRSPRPFFSRRIGIVDGQQRDILAGIKLTGRQGALRFGLLDVQMKPDEQLGQKNLGVARFALDVLDESSVGIIATNGDPASRGDNTLIGSDFNYRTRDPVTGDRFDGSFWAMGTHTNPDDAPAENGEPFAAGFRLSAPNEPFNWSLGMTHVGPDFDPALGFVSRRDRRFYNGRAEYRIRPEDASDPVRFYEINADAEVITFPNNEIEEADLGAPGFQVFTAQDDFFFLRPHYHHERLIEPFEIIDGVVIPTDAYNDLGIRGGVETSRARLLSGSVTAEHRSFFTGTRTDLNTRLEVRPNANLMASLGYIQNDVHLESGDFVVRIVRVRADVLFTPDLTWSNLIQWDNLSQNANVNSRVRWEFDPGQELFLVYNEAIFTENQEFETLGRAVSVKAGLTFRF